MRFHLTGNAAETVGQKLSDIPACAVRSEKSEVVKVDSSALVSLSDLFRIYLIEPILFGEVLANVVVESVDALLHIGVFLYSPILFGKVAGKKLARFSDKSVYVSCLLSSFTVENVSLCGLSVSFVDEHFFDDVLNVLNGGYLVVEFGFRRFYDEVCKRSG